METPYDLLYITKHDYSLFQKKTRKNKIQRVLNIVSNHLPENLKSPFKFAIIYLKPIDGFEDKEIKGYEVCVKGDEKVEKFIRNYVPFFLMRKRG